MRSNMSIHQAVEELEASLASNPAAGGVPLRILKLVNQVVNHWKETKTLQEVSSLTDGELLRSFAESSALMTASDTRETRKLARRAQAKIDFFAKLKEFGGLLKAKAVAETLGLSRQSVNNHASKGTLVAIQDGHDYFFPGFQFTESGKLPHLEEILGLLKGASPEATCTFFLNPILIPGGGQALPYELLKNGADDQVIEAIRREAELYQTGVPS
jgi:hypothetical protein